MLARLVLAPKHLLALYLSGRTHQLGYHHADTNSRQNATILASFLQPSAQQYLRYSLHGTQHGCGKIEGKASMICFQPAFHLAHNPKPDEQNPAVGYRAKAGKFRARKTYQIICAFTWVLHHTQDCLFWAFWCCTLLSKLVRPS